MEQGKTVFKTTRLRWLSFAAKVCSAKVCSAKVCSAKVCLAKVCLAKVCLAKVCSAKVCSANKKKQFTLHTGSIGHQKVVTRNATAICSKLASATQASKKEALTRPTVDYKSEAVGCVTCSWILLLCILN